MAAILAFKAPALEKYTVRPRGRPTNAELRARECLTEAEVESLMTAAKQGRWGKRDSTMILLAYRHGLRVSELVDLRWEQVVFDQATLHVNRRKNGKPAAHPLTGRELRALRELKRESKSPFVFTSERNGPFSTNGFRRIVERATARAGLALKVHVHMLRHSCGYDLANKGTDTRTIQDYLGHRNIANTVRYTELSSSRFKGLFRD